MCGIVYVKRKDGKPAQKQLLKRYSKQKDRGTDGFGYVALDETNKVSKYRRFQYEKEARKSLEMLDSTQVLFHHRYPTSTPNIPESAHPILVSHKELAYDYYVVHNGVISNDDKLKEVHDKLGYTYTTEIKTEYKTHKGKVFYGSSQFNDSEALAIELARNIEGLQLTTNALGAIAYIVLQVDKRNSKTIVVYYGTNGGNPLTLDKNPNGFVIASQGGKAINAGKCFRLDCATDEITVATHVILHEYETRSPVGFTTGYGGYSGYSGGYSGYQRDDSDYGAGYSAGSEYDTMGEEELEYEIDSIEESMASVQADIKIAVQAGELSEEEELRIELKQLTDMRNRLHKLYDTKSLAF